MWSFLFWLSSFCVCVRHKFVLVKPAEDMKLKLFGSTVLCYIKWNESFDVNYVSLPVCSCFYGTQHRGWWVKRWEKRRKNMGAGEVTDSESGRLEGLCLSSAPLLCFCLWATFSWMSRKHSAEVLQVKLRSFIISETKTYRSLFNKFTFYCSAKAIQIKRTCCFKADVCLAF